VAIVVVAALVAVVSIPLDGLFGVLAPGWVLVFRVGVAIVQPQVARILYGQLGWVLLERP